MNTNKAIQYLSGYVDIVIEGYYIEKFINICNNEHIELWNIKRENAIKLHTSVEIKNFKLLRNICKKTKCKVKIEKKSGLPFVIKKYKKRKVFIIILLIIIMGIITLSNFIRNIEVEGNSNIPKEELISLASKYGLSVGQWKGKVDEKDVINKIRLERDDIAWVGIDIKGTNAIIKIVEADKKPEIIDEDEYCNIVADKDAMITKVSAQNGTPLVKAGDIVKKGNTLIAGWLEGKYTGKQYVHSHGDIQAKVWYTTTEKIDLKETKKVETGNTENKYSVKINNFEINLFKSLPKFQKYDTINENKKLKLFSNFYLPFEIVKYTYTEYEENTVVHSIEEAKQMGVDKAAETLKENIEGKEILDKQVTVKQYNNYIEVQVTYEVEENIGVEEKIVF